MSSPVVTRFAPSPTGYLHIGGARTALFNWLYSRHTGGKMLLRIEDTDRERSTEPAIEAIKNGLTWLGLDWQGDAVSQFSRAGRHREVVEELLKAGKAYRCYCTPEELTKMREKAMAEGKPPRYDGRWRPERAKAAGLAPPSDRPPVVRFRTPQEGDIGWHDLVKGPISFPNAELDDLVILRADGVPTYNFGVVVDDFDMNITHVIRGDDHVNNTPRQINMLKAMGGELPTYAHLPMILGPDGAKLSKRHGAVSVLQYREDGYLPEALLNYLARLGWSHGDQEIFTLEEMCRLFDINDVNKSAAAINPDKLIWLNQQHLMRIPEADIARELRWHLEKLEVDVDAGPSLEAVVASQKERSRTLAEMAANSVFFFREPAWYEEKAAKKNLTPDSAPLLAAARERLAALPEWVAPAIHEAINGVAAEQGVGLGRVAQPVRVAVAGGSVSPPIDVTLELVGRERALKRLDHAIELIEARAAAGAG